MAEDWGSEQPAVLETASIKLFGRWDLDEVNVNDISLTVSAPISSSPALVCLDDFFVSKDYVAVKEKSATYVPHTAGRYAAKRFRKALVRTTCHVLSSHRHVTTCGLVCSWVTVHPGTLP